MNTFAINLCYSLWRFETSSHLTLHESITRLYFKTQQIAYPKQQLPEVNYLSHDK